MFEFIFLITVSVFNPIFGVGSDAILSNPANLGLPNNPVFSYKIFDVIAFVENNSFNIAQYNRYNGTFIDERGKKWLLGAVPNRGLVMNAGVKGAMPRFNYGNWAIAVQTDAAAEAQFPKELINLLLNGNKLGQVYSANDATAQVTSFLKSGTGMGKRWGNFAGGVSISYIRGLYYLKMLNHGARIVATRTGFAGEGCVGYLKTGHGNGWTIDAGGVYYKDRFYIGMAVFGLTPGIVWQDVEEVYWTFRVDSAYLYELFTDSSKVDYRISRSLGNDFVTFLPIRLNLGIGYQIPQVFKSGVLLTPGFDIESFGLKKFTAELVSELAFRQLVPICFTFGFDSRLGVIIGINTGLIWKGWTFEIGVREVGGLLSFGKGGSVKIAIGYVVPSSRGH